jgi:hypothetical protein
VKTELKLLQNKRMRGPTYKSDSNDLIHKKNIYILIQGLKLVDMGSSKKKIMEGK